MLLKTKPFNSHIPYLIRHSATDKGKEREIATGAEGEGMREIITGLQQESRMIS
jgi:hypothetical protein